ncbi:MAG TPA: EAL domain-containing protein, partial [Myxococcota bacterium]|nr:EAL domain-containing protein [Myxococcota bacterium]
VRNYELLGRGLSELRKAGARLAIDDVGAGYANLAHVVRLKPDYLKLDMSLVRDVHIERAKRALVRSLLVASEDIGARVVAEGIEKEEERATVVELGIPLAQGFLWGLPAPGFAVPRRHP